MEIKKLSKNNVKDEINLCLKYHPLITESKARGTQYPIACFAVKKRWLLGLTKTYGCCGLIAYEKEPVGFIEFLPKKVARRAGFVTSRDDSFIAKTLTITCLSVRRRWWRKGVASNLLKILLEYAKKRHFKKIEVGTFPDRLNWQPRSLYKKHGFSVEERRGKETWVMAIYLEGHASNCCKELPLGLQP